MPPARTLSTRPSGLPPVDAGWGGLASGGTYLLVGHARNGRLRLALQALQAGAEAGESCLLVSARAPEALVQQAAAQDFDLAAAYRSGHVRLLRVPPAADLVPLGDDGLAQALADLGDLARAQRPARVVVDDFTAFVQFRTFAAFETALRELVGAADEAGTTLILGFGEPANDGSRRLLATVEKMVTGAIHVTAGPGEEPALTLVPAPAPKRRVFSFVETPLAADPAPVQEEPDAAFAMPSSDGYGAVPDALPDLVVAPPPQTPPPASPPAPAAPAPAAPAAGAETAARPTETEAVATAPFGPDSFDHDPIVETAPPAPPTDVEASVIRPIDPDAGPFAPTEDAFGQYLGPDLLSLGHFVDSEVHGATEPTYDEAPADLDGAAATVHAAAYPEVFAPPQAAPAAPVAPLIPPPPADSGPHAALRRALREAFGTRNTRPFLVLALRLDAASPFADLMPAIGEALRAALGERGVLEADIAVPRTVAFLPGVGGEAASLLFEAIQSYLRAVAPNRADAALAAVNALVVPNGQPFNTADELLAYVFEE